VKPSAARPKFLALNLLFTVCALAAPPSIPHVKQVDEHLYRGGQPNNKELKALRTVGVKAVIDLRGAGERSKREEQTVEALGMKYYSVPLQPMAAPTDEQIALLLSLIDDSNNWPVFIHCERGKDRTGTVVACYRIAHDGWPNERALTEAVDDGLNIFERSMKNYIRHYKPPVSAVGKSLTAGR
jgi:protein tyrosine/serine phosphatase